MPPRPPALVLFGAQALTLLQRLLDAAVPQEGCGLLLGERWPLGGEPASGLSAGRQGETWLLRQIWPCCNVWEPAAERHRRFAIDPREQLHAIRWGRSRGMELLGSVHSHPSSAPIPSATDCALAVWPTLMVIRGIAVPNGGAGEGPDQQLRCWWVEADATPLQLPWRMED
jgi:proteasome lid subunit RPN8/RPN11